MLIFWCSAFFWALLKLWCPHAVEQRHEISAGEWIWGHGCSHCCCYSRGNPSDQPETLEKKVQGSWWLLLNGAPEIWFLTNQGDLQSCALLAPPVFGAALWTARLWFCRPVMVSQRRLGRRNLMAPTLVLTHVGSRVRLHSGSFSLYKVRKLCTEAVKRI